ncbi:MAG: MFS transporter [Gammaproteobacteria bacterium]|nr:MFS transporter [Gammaproteobacteria bacterium]
MSGSPHHRRNTVRIAAVVALGGFLFGFDASVISGVVTYIIPEFSLNELKVGLVVGAPTLAGIAAGLLAGPTADFIGRKKVLLILAALYTISALGSAFAPNYQTLVAARAIGGFAFASLGIAPMYIAEIAPHERREFLVSFNQFNIMIGFSVAYFANYFVLQLSQSSFTWVEALGIDRHAWRWMLGLEILPASIWLAGLLFIPETPRWLALNGGIERARAVLAGIRPRERVETTLREILASGGDAGRSLAARLGEVLSPKLRLPILIGITVGVFQQVTGINAVYFYAPTIFEQSGVGTNAAFAQATLIGITNIVFTIAAMLLIDRLGRKPLLLIGLLGIVVSMGIAGHGFQQATYQLDEAGIEQLSQSIDRAALEPLAGIQYDNDLDFKRAAEAVLGAQQARNHQAALIEAAIQVNPTIILIGILGFVASFALSLGPVMWVLFSEIFPNRVRGVALGITSVFNSASSFVVQFVFPWELANLGNAMTFYIFAALGIIGLLLIAWLLPETKGKSLEELEGLLAR